MMGTFPTWSHTSPKSVMTVRRITVVSKLTSWPRHKSDKLTGLSMLRFSDKRQRSFPDSDASVLLPLQVNVGEKAVKTVERWLKAQEKVAMTERASRVHWKRPKPPVSW